METINRVEHEEKADSGRLWALAPLVGKYYGTVVCYDGENVLRVFKPDYSATPFASTREVLHGWTPEDGNRFVEDQQSYRLAKRLVEFLNQAGFELK